MNQINWPNKLDELWDCLWALQYSMVERKGDDMVIRGPTSRQPLDIFTLRLGKWTENEKSRRKAMRKYTKRYHKLFKQLLNRIASERDVFKGELHEIYFEEDR